jgi:hypothetical protein
MSDLDGTFYGNGTVIKVEGLSRLNRQLTKAGVDAEDMKATMQSIGQAVINVAHAPVRTGRLASTLRASKAKNKATVKAGGARAPYAGVSEYGWAARGINGSGWLNAARDSRRGDSERMIREGIADVLRKNDLD